MFNGELPLPKQPIQYVMSLMCVPYTDFFSCLMALGVGICVTETHFSLLLVNNYIPIFPLSRLFAALIRPTHFSPKIVSEYDQEIPQSQIADNPVAPRGRAAQPSQDTRKTN